MTELSNNHASRIAGLSKDLDPSRSLRAYQWMQEFISTCDLVERALVEKGVTEAADSLLQRAHAGAHVPTELHKRAQAFQEAGYKLFLVVKGSALDWVESQSSRPDVLKFVEQEKQKAEDEDNNVVELFPSDKHRRKQSVASIWGDHAARAG